MSNQGSHPTDKTDLSSNVPNSDWAKYGKVSQEWMLAKNPEELKEAAFRWSLSADAHVRTLGRSLLSAIEAEGGEAQRQIRDCLPWTVALSHRLVPVSLHEPFVVVLHAGEVTVEALNLVMAYAKRPVQWVHGTDAEVARELLSCYGSEIPTSLLERFVNDPAVAWSGNPNPVLMVPEAASAPVADEPEIEEVFEEAPEAENESNWSGLPDGDDLDAPATVAATEFPVEVLRDLRAVPMGEDESGIEFLVASPAENETLRALSELSQGAARFRIADFEEVAAAWTARYGDELSPLFLAPNQVTSAEAFGDEVTEVPIVAEEILVIEESFIEEITIEEVAESEPVETEIAENLTPWQIAESRTPEDGLDSVELEALVSQYEVSTVVEEETAPVIAVSEDDAEADWDSLLAEAEEESLTAEEENSVPEVTFDPLAWAKCVEKAEVPPTAEPEVEAPAAEIAEEVPAVAEVASFEPVEPHVDAVNLVPASLAWFARACPMELRGEELVCWAMEPFDESLLTAIERRAERRLIVEPRPQEEVLAALQAAYPTDFAGVAAPVAEVAAAPVAAPMIETAEPDLAADLSAEVESALAEPVETSDWDQPAAIAEPEADVADEWATDEDAAPEAEWEAAEDSRECIPMPPPLSLDEFKVALKDEVEVAPVAATPEVTPEPTPEPEPTPTQNTGSPALDDLLARIGIARGDVSAPPVAAPVVDPVAEAFAQVTELEPEAESEVAEVAIPEPSVVPEPPQAEEFAAPVEETPALTPAEAEVASFDSAPVAPSAEKTEDGFTLSATEEARAAWLEFMSGENQPTVQPRSDTTPIMIEQMLDRMNREIEVERAAARAIPSADFKEEDDDGRASSDAGFLTEEEAEESRIALEHASAIQRLMGQSLVPKPEILARFSRDTAIRLRTLPVTIEGGTLHVMGASALSEESVQMLSDESGLPIQLHLAPADHLQRMLDKAYPDPDRDLEQHTKVAELRRQQEMDDKGWLSKLMNRVNRGA
jgi:hypothetical protein